MYIYYTQLTLYLSTSHSGHCETKMLAFVSNIQLFSKEAEQRQHRFLKTV